ncbi:hypothetical protein TPDSL_21280 [Terrisporobacter petrolearius]
MGTTKYDKDGFKYYTYNKDAQTNDPTNSYMCIN